jgi:hypothetical protein
MSHEQIAIGVFIAIGIVYVLLNSPACRKGRLE